MKNQEEPVFEIIAEGGGIHIMRINDASGEKFIYHHNEFDPTDEGMGVSRKGEYDNFEQPFQIINNKYPWYFLHLETVHPDYRDFVISELIKKLNEKQVSLEEMKYYKDRLEKALGVKLDYGAVPIQNGLQNIKVSNLMKLTEYEYSQFTKESGKQDRIKGKYEIWTDDQVYSPDYMEIMTAKFEFKTVGKLEVTGSAVIIRNEFNQIEFVFPSDKYFVSAKPIYGKEKSWFYANA